MASEPEEPQGEELWTEEELKRPPRSLEETVKLRTEQIEKERERLKAKASRNPADPYTEDEIREKLEQKGD